MELELKDFFYEAKKVRMLAELQASYTSKMFGLHDEQYELGYWAGYAEGELVARGGQEESPGSTPEPTHNTKSTELSTLVEEASATAEEVWVLLVPTGERTFKAVEAVSTEPVFIILQELSLVVHEPSVPPLENVL